MSNLSPMGDNKNDTVVSNLHQFIVNMLIPCKIGERQMHVKNRQTAITFNHPDTILYEKAEYQHQCLHFHFCNFVNF